jgi:hypothetical protein
MRRSNVIAAGGEDDERIADASQVCAAAVADAEPSLLELVADEQFLDDGEDLFTAQEIIAVPPPLELEKTLSFRVDVGEQARVLFPDRFIRL